MLCAPVQSEAAAPHVPQTILGYTPMRSTSPLSVGEEPVKKPVASFHNCRRTTLRFPCKARGVPDNHNARSAQVDVPPDAVHGSILVCSHAACCGSGRKFRWCEVCGVPVAKRNFGKRHSHGILMPSQLAVEEEKAEDDGSSSQSLKRQRLNTVGSFGEALKLLEGDCEELVRKEVSSKVPTTVVVEPAPSVTDTIITAASTETTISELTDQERQWLDLFRKRPTQPTSEHDFRSWMEAVVETAELKPSETTEEDQVDEARDEGDTEEEKHEDSSVWDMQDLLMVDDDFLGDWGY